MDKWALKLINSIIPDKNTKYSFLQHGWSLDVPPDKLDIFNKQINDLIFNKNVYISLTETFGELSPLLIDIDLKYNDISNKKRRYTTDTITKLVLLIKKQVKKDNKITFFVSNLSFIK